MTTYGAINLHGAALSSYGLMTLCVNVYHSIEFPLLLQLYTGSFMYPRPHSNLGTIPSLSQFLSQIGFFLFVQFSILRTLVTMSIMLHQKKGGGSAIPAAAAAYDISYKVISMKAAFLIGLYVMGSPGRLTLVTGLVHGIVVAVWMVVQQYIILRKYGGKEAP